MHNWTLESSSVKSSLVCLSFGKISIAHSSLFGHYTLAPRRPAFIFRGCLSFECITHDSSAASIGTLGLPTFASFFQLPFCFSPIFILAGLTAFLCLLYSFISGACGCIKQGSWSCFHFLLDPRENSYVGWAMSWCKHEGLGANGDCCSFQARPPESPVESSTFILTSWIGHLEWIQQWFGALEVSGAVGDGGSPR